MISAMGKLQPFVAESEIRLGVDLNFARRRSPPRGGQMGGQIRAGFFAQKSHLRVATLQQRPLRPIANHNLGSSQAQGEKRLEVFYDRDTADSHEDRSGQIELGRLVGAKEAGVDAS